MNATPLRRAENSWYGIFDNPSPLIKQAPTAVAGAPAALFTWLYPELPFSDFNAALAGLLLVLFATVHAGILSARRVYDGWIVLVIPMIDIIGLGLFRAGTGGPTSVFTSLVLLPVVWIAAAPGIRYVFAVGALTSFALLMPYITEPPGSSVEWLRGVVGPLVFSALAAVVNELSRQQRLRVRQAELLVAERTSALSENVVVLERLQEKEREYRQLLDSFQSLWASITVQAVVAVDLTGRITEWNPGAVRLLGLTVQEAQDDVRVDRFFTVSALTQLVGDAPCAAAGADLPSGLKALFARAEAERSVEGDVDVTTAGGTVVPARVTISPRRDATGETQGYLLVLTDETRAVEVARMKDEFVGMISHELRTPLSAIIGFLDLLRNDPGQPLSEEQEEFVGIIERNAQRLLTLVGDLLFTAQVESGRFPLDRSEIDLAEIVRNAVTSSGPHAQREGVELVAETPSTPVRVVADPGRIGQALDNLLSNAIKFTPSGGRVTAARPPPARRRCSPAGAARRRRGPRQRSRRGRATT